MTGRELILNAAHRKSSDGIMPVYFHFADAATEQKYARELGMTQEELRSWMNNDIEDIFLYEDIQMICSDPKAYATSKRLGFAHEREEDNIAYDDWGCGWSIIAIGQELRSQAFTDIEKAYDWKYPDPDRPGVFYEVEEKIKQIHERGHASFIAQYFGLFERAWGMIGYENFLASCYSDPDEVEYLLDRIMENRIRMAEKICSFNPTIGHTGDDFGLQLGGVMSLEMFRKFFKPRYEKIWKVYKDYGIPVMHHSCGNCMAYLDDMIEIGLDILHPVQQTAMDIKEIGRRFGRDLSFFGSIDTIKTMTDGTPDDVKRNVDETVEHLGRYNGLILSMINVMPNTPTQNVKAAIDQIHSYRR